MHNLTQRAAALALAAPLALVGLSSPASAANAGAVDITTGDVTAACNLLPVLLLGPGGGLQVAFDGTATSGSRARTVATNITCTVKTNSGSFGGASLAAPGPSSAIAGTSDEIPFAKIAGLRVCAYGSSFLQGGGTITNTPSPGC